MSARVIIDRELEAWSARPGRTRPTRAGQHAWTRRKRPRRGQGWGATQDHRRSRPMIGDPIRPRCLSIEGAGTYLAVSRSTILRLIARGEIWASKIGTRQVVDVRSLDTFLERRSILPKLHRQATKPVRSGTSGSEGDSGDLAQTGFDGSGRGVRIERHFDPWPRPERRRSLGGSTPPPMRTGPAASRQLARSMVASGRRGGGRLGVSSGLAFSEGRSGTAPDQLDQLGPVKLRMREADPSCP